MSTKKAAIMIYPYFSLQEVSCLTAGLTIYYGYELAVFASSKEVMRSEEGFAVIADYTFDEFQADEFDCVILPGILNPLPALFNSKNIEFLRALANKDIVIAAICSAPILLAKAGVLENKRFVCSIFDEVIQHYDFIPEQNVQYKPILRDGNIITAHGFAYREFAVEVMHALGIDCGDNMFLPAKEYTAENLCYKMGEQNFADFCSEYTEYAQGKK